MILTEQFQAVVQEIVALGYDRDTATNYATCIGNRPLHDRDGLVVVQAGKKVFARLKLKSFEPFIMIDSPPPDFAALVKLAGEFMAKGYDRKSAIRLARLELESAAPAE